MTVGLGSNSGHTCLCGWGEQSKPIADINFTVKGSLNEATINGMNSEISDSRLDVEQKPNHLLMPVMVFIGRRNRD